MTKEETMAKKQIEKRGMEIIESFPMIPRASSLSSVTFTVRNRAASS